MEPFHCVMIIAALAFYLLGRLCDDMSWHQFTGLSGTGFQAIAVGGLAASAIIITILRLREENGYKIIFFHSQMKFIIPWALVITESILVFQIFGCYHEFPEETSFIDMEYKGCILYSVTLLLTNLNYSLICNNRGDLPLLVVFMIVLFAEIIYNGTLLITFINELKEKPKDYSILFVSILIAWEVLVMDLMFRGAYEEKEKDLRHQELEHLVLKHHEKCKGEIRSADTNDRLHHHEMEIPTHPSHTASHPANPPAPAPDGGKAKI